MGVEDYTPQRGFPDTLTQKVLKEQSIAGGGKAPLRIVLVGTPSAGKSFIFHMLTGVYATVYRYPNTGVDVARGFSFIAGQKVEIFDTPGLYSLLPMTEEERVTRELLLEEPPQLVLQVVEAKHLQRMLNLTHQLQEAELPVLLVINALEESWELGLEVDVKHISSQLGVPVAGITPDKEESIHGLIAMMEELLSSSHGEGGPDDLYADL